MQYSTITTLNSLIINSISTSAFFISASVFCACFALIVIGFAQIDDFLELLLVGIVGTILLVFIPILIGGFIAIFGIAFPLTGELPEWIIGETLPKVYVPIYFRISFAFFIWTVLIFYIGKHIDDFCVPFEGQRWSVRTFVLITVIATTVISLLILL